MTEHHPVARKAGYLRQWARLFFTMGWLLVAVHTSFVPYRRQPSGELPMWKQAAWFVLVLIVMYAAIYVLKA
ncbi:MAG: hypothetical protein ABJB47_21650 [Actinomycetota bacterium]